MEKFEKVFTVDKNLTRDEFIKKVIIRLGTDKNSPVDVCNAEFGEIVETTREVILCFSYADLDYTTSIGYKRTEEYWDKEKKVKKINGERHEYLVDVKKKRTVTDWTPLSGHISGDAEAYVFNEDNPSIMVNRDELESLMESIASESISEISETKMVSNYGLDRAKEVCKRIVQSRIHYPGDCHEGTSSSGTIDVKALHCYILPLYCLDFVYNGETYHAYEFACGKTMLLVDIPKNEHSIEENVDKETKKSRVIFQSLGFASIIGLFISFILTGFKMYWIWIVYIPLFIATIISSVNYEKKYKETEKKFNEEFVNKKREIMKNALKSRGYELPTE